MTLILALIRIFRLMRAFRGISTRRTKSFAIRTAIEKRKLFGMHESSARTLNTTEHNSSHERAQWTIRYRHIVLIGALAACVGCGDGRPARVPVSGIVLIDGQPLT